MADIVAGRITPSTPALEAVSGHPVVMTYTNVADEYAALRQRAVVVDRSQRVRLRLTGEKAAEMIAGLVTNDTLALQPGQGQYAGALSPKGKLIADVRVFVEEGGVLTDTGARAGDGWRAMLKKYVNPRFAPCVDESGSTRSLAVFGPTARHVVEAMTGINSSALSILPPYSHARIGVDGVEILVAHTPELLAGGFELFMPSDAFDGLWQRAVKAGAVACGLSAWEIVRVESGRPEWGLDMDETTLAQEANLDELQAISYTKGCYVGQEVVARVHFKGHVNRHLRGLRGTGATPLVSGAVLHGSTGKPVGEVRSAVVSPSLGPIALGMVRRELRPGSVVAVRWEGGETTAEVYDLPFPEE